VVGSAQRGAVEEDAGVGGVGGELEAADRGGHRDLDAQRLAGFAFDGLFDRAAAGGFEEQRVGAGGDAVAARSLAEGFAVEADAGVGRVEREFEGDVAAQAGEGGFGGFGEGGAFAAVDDGGGGVGGGDGELHAVAVVVGALGGGDDLSGEAQGAEHGAVVVGAGGGVGEAAEVAVPAHFGEVGLARGVVEEVVGCGAGGAFDGGLERRPGGAGELPVVGGAGGEEDGGDEGQHAGDFSRIEAVRQCNTSALVRTSAGSARVGARLPRRRTLAYLLRLPPARRRLARPES
jgi:hypothetical protein